LFLLIKKKIHVTLFLFSELKLTPLNRLAKAATTVADRALLPFVFTHERRLYCVWWKLEHLSVRPSQVWRDKVKVEVVLEPPTQGDLDEVVPGLPPLDLEPKASCFEVSFPDTPIVTGQVKRVQSDRFVGFSALLDDGGESVLLG
jgi:hypothetical protein